MEQQTNKLKTHYLELSSLNTYVISNRSACRKGVTT